MPVYFSYLLGWLSKLAVIILASSLSGCYPVQTTTLYNKGLTNGQALSQRIYLSFRDTKNASFHLRLKHNIVAKEYLLLVYWDSPSSSRLFAGAQPTIKFLVDGSEIIMPQTIKKPQVVSYNLDTKSRQEEAIFQITLSQLNALAGAKNVEVELSGQHITVVGRFNRRHTTKAFKDFIRHS